MAIVEAVYRVVGALAPINQRLWRLRLNMVPANVLLIIGLGTGAAVCWHNIGRVLESRRALEPEPLSALLSGKRPARNYVSLQGRLVSDARIAFGQEGAAGTLAALTWVPLQDEATGKAILVQLAADYALPGNGADVTLEGTLRPIASPVSPQLSPNRFVHAGMPIERRFMLVEGRRPGSLGGSITIGSVCAILALALAWATLSRNVIFMADGDTPAAGTVAFFDSPSPEPLLVSGTLAFDAKTRRFFAHMPALMRRMDTGDTAIISHIETSSTFFGVKRTEHSGVWMLGIRPGSITEAQTGYVFWGHRKLRATRFRYVSTMTGASERAVVATA